MKLVGGYTNYGQDIGVLMLDTIFPRIPRRHRQRQELPQRPCPL